MISVLAVVLALLVGGIMIAFTDEEVQAPPATSSPGRATSIAAVWEAVSGAYVALFQGRSTTSARRRFERGIRPLTETLTFATPLIAAGLGVALAFRVGMFNIGGRGQMLMAVGCRRLGRRSRWICRGGIHMLVALARRPGRRSAVGRHRRAAEGVHGRARGDRDDHAQLHRVLPVSLHAPHPGLLQAPGSSNPKTPADEGDRGASRIFSDRSTTCTSASSS